MSGTMAAFNGVGRLTRDSELKYTNSGLAVLHFTIATDSRVKKGEDWVDEPSYWDVELWGKQGESIAQYLTKGKPVALMGEQRIDKWEKDGVEHMKVKITASTVKLLPSNDSVRNTTSTHDNKQAPSNNTFVDDEPPFN
jgi:single-strand DNA-binding protein